MNIKKLLCAVFVLVFFSALPAYAGSPVWRVSKGDQQLFIGGTIHLLTQADYPLPDAFDKVYRHAAVVVLETDMQKLQDPQYQQLMINSSMYTDGRTLQSVLKPETFNALKQHLDSRGVPIANLLPFKAGMASMTVTMMELQRLGLVGTGVDEFFSKKAAQDGKKLGELESVEQQIEFLAALGEGREDEMIAYTLRDVNELPSFMQAIKEAWRQGDLVKLKEVTLDPFKKEFPGAYQSLLVERNNNWLPKIEGMLQSKEIELILVGALHLVGKDGVLQQLANRGYKIQKLK